MAENSSSSRGKRKRKLHRQTSIYGYNDYANETGKAGGTSISDTAVLDLWKSRPGDIAAGMLPTNAGAMARSEGCWRVNRNATLTACYSSERGRQNQMSPADRASLLAQAEQLLKQSNFSRESASKVESLLMLADRVTDHDSLRRATMAARARELGHAPEHAEPTPADEQFNDYLRAFDVSEVRRLEKRAGLNVGTDSAGGFTAPDGFAQRVESAMVAYDQLFDAAGLFITQRGGAFRFPMWTMPRVLPTVVAEGTTSDTSADVLFGGIQFPKIQTFRSGFVAVSWELLQDSSFDVPALLEATFGKRLARGVGRYLVGVLHASAPIGVTAASATVVTADEVVNLMDSLDADYQGQAAFLMAQQTLNAIHKLKSSTGGAFMFPAAQDADGRQLLMGRRVFVSPSMGLLAACGLSDCVWRFKQIRAARSSGRPHHQGFPGEQCGARRKYFRELFALRRRTAGNGHQLAHRAVINAGRFINGNPNRISVPTPN